MIETSEDRLLDGKVTLRQPVDGYRAAIDPVFLAAMVPAKAGQMVLDVASGVGAASLCLARRVEGVRIVGIEMQAEMAILARQNIEANGLQGRVEAMVGNLAAPPPRLAPGSFHHVMTNPPYQPAEGGSRSPHAAKALANQETGIDLAAWMRFAVNMLQPKGSLVIIHRADRLDALLAALHGRVGEIVVTPLWPKAGRPAKRVLLCGRKGIASPLTLAPGLVLHADDGRFTVGAEAILRGAKGFD